MYDTNLTVESLITLRVVVLRCCAYTVCDDADVLSCDVSVLGNMLTASNSPLPGGSVEGYWLGLKSQQICILLCILQGRFAYNRMARVGVATARCSTSASERLSWWRTQTQILYCQLRESVDASCRNQCMPAEVYTLGPKVKLLKCKQNLLLATRNIQTIRDVRRAEQLARSEGVRKEPWRSNPMLHKGKRGGGWGRFREDPQGEEGSEVFWSSYDQGTRRNGHSWQHFVADCSCTIRQAYAEKKTTLFNTYNAVEEEHLTQKVREVEVAHVNQQQAKSWQLMN